MRIHFIGIGGIGVSALAQYYLNKGHFVKGSDLAFSEITDLLKEKGARILLEEHKTENLDNNIDLVIYSPAVQEDNPELKKAKEIGIKTQSYPEDLGDLTKQYFTIAVSGTHGKSTTTAMIALILEKAGLDPTVIIGTKLREFNNTNFRAGESKYLVIEADEWQASFLNYWPKIIVLNNIEEEHLDYYKDLNHILETYREYVGRLAEDGVLIYNEDDENIRKILKSKNQMTNDKSNPNAKVQIKKFSYKCKEAKILEEILQMPGQHNVYNALAALNVARTLEIKDEISFEALSQYKGSWRRFEILEGKAGDKKITIISDYGHHPTEIKSTLGAVREKYPKNRIWCVYQPHQYQRTFYLFDDFVRVFKSALIDNIIITDIYDVPGREEGEISSKVSSEKLAQAANKPNVSYQSNDKLENYLKENLKNKDILVIMGAGDIYHLVNKFVNTESR